MANHSVTIYLVIFVPHEELFMSTLKEAVGYVREHNRYYEIWAMKAHPEYSVKEYMIAALNGNLIAKMVARDAVVQQYVPGPARPRARKG